MRENNDHVVKFGWWSGFGDHCYPLVWHADTGWIDLDGCHIVKVKSEERVNNILLGWENHLGQPNAVQWLMSRLEGVR